MYILRIVPRRKAGAFQIFEEATERMNGKWSINFDKN